MELSSIWFLCHSRRENVVKIKLLTPSWKLVRLCLRNAQSTFSIHSRYNYEWNLFFFTNRNSSKVHNSEDSTKWWVKWFVRTKSTYPATENGRSVTMETAERQKPWRSENTKGSWRFYVVKNAMPDLRLQRMENFVSGFEGKDLNLASLWDIL